jgi:DNA-binding PucR family transcriptional regulator
MKTEDQIRYETGQIKFWNRETYLNWRTNWRARYARASQAIRDTKKALKAAYRENDFAEASGLQRQLHYIRDAARTLMMEREAATKFKQAQFAKAKAQQEALRLLEA